MRFFKYLVFIFLTLFSVNVFADYSVGGFTASTELAACNAFYANTGYTTKEVRTSGSARFCYVVENAFPNSPPVQGQQVISAPSSCKADGTSVYSGSVTVSDWKDDAEYLSLTEQASSKFEGTYVCSNSCRFNYDFLAGDGDAENGPIVFKGRYSRTTTSCVSGDTSPNASITGSGKPKSECTKAYCDKEPNKSCPDGYSQGSFNGKQICVKNSPKNPNPNDPNTPYDPNNPPDNGGGDGKCNGTNNCNTNNYEFDVSQIVNAISSQTSAITSAISQQTSSLSSAISSAAGSINSALSSGFSSLKSAIDSTTSAINSVKTAVDSNTAAVNANGEKLDELNQTAKDSKSLLQQIKDFFTEDHALPSDDSSVQVGEIQLPDYEKNYVVWAAHCPPDNHVNINLMGQNSNLVLSWSPWCELLSKIRWAIIACAYFAAAYIILGMR